MSCERSKSCEYCNKPFYYIRSEHFTKRRFCSKKCSGLYQRGERIIRPIKYCICGKLLKGYPCEIKERVFCSNKCAQLHRPHKEKRIKYLIKKCKYCNKIFSKPCKKNYINQNFCSKMCYFNFKKDKNWKTLINKRCLYCNKIIEHTAKTEKVSDYKKRKYCSLSCAGKNNPSIEKWKKTPFYYKTKFSKYLNHLYRSMWEFNICKILKDNNIKYEYEPQAFKVKKINSNYFPDIIINNKIIISIKGYLREKEKIKEFWFKQENPNYIYCVITGKYNFLNYDFADKLFNYKSVIKNPNDLISYISLQNKEGVSI